MLKHNRLSTTLSTALLLTLPFLSAVAAPQPNGYYYADQQTTAIREMRDSLETVKHSVRNQEAEIRTFEEKLENLDSIIESVRDQISDTSKSHKDQLKGSSAALETKLTALETSVKGILADLKQFQTYSTESSATLAQYKKKITELEKSIEIQNQNIDDMQAAIKALMDIVQIKNPGPKKVINEIPQMASKPVSQPLSDPPSPTTTTSSIPSSQPETLTSTSEILYKVKEGDSLEKIARAHQTSVKAIKELNNLANDKIIVGKTLKIPQN